MEEAKVKNLYSLGNSIAGDYLARFEYPWEALEGLGGFITELGKTLSPDEFDNPAPGVWIAKDASVAPSASVTGPCIIDRGAEIRQCAFIRGKAIVGKKTVIGNSCELKNALIFDGAQVPHFNYVGDSVLGYKAHMGAGSITSNVKADKLNVVVKFGLSSVETGRKKVGAFLGDFAEIGCNAVLNPGTVVGKNSNVYPLTSVRGVIPENCICKKPGIIVKKH